MLKVFVILAFWMVVWQVAADFTPLPPPAYVYMELLTLALSSRFWLDLWASLFVALMGLGFALPLGLLLFVLGRVAFFNTVLWPIRWLSAVPAVVIALVAVVMLPGRAVLITAALSALPIVYQHAQKAVDHVSPEIKELLTLYRLPLHRRWPVYRPSFAKGLKGGICGGLAHAIRGGITAEVLIFFVVNASFGGGLGYAMAYTSAALDERLLALAAALGLAALALRALLNAIWKLLEVVCSRLS